MAFKPVNRRDFVKKLSIGALATGGLLTAGHKIAAAPEPRITAPYPLLPGIKPAIPDYNEQSQFFDKHQYALVATLAAIIIPSEDGPGATEAGVVDYVDKFVANSKRRQGIYATGLKWIDGLSCDRYETDFLALEITQQIHLLSQIDTSATRWHRPVSGFFDRICRKLNRVWDDQFGMGRASTFFKIVLKDVISAFYAHPISWQAIGYYGPPQPVGYLDYTRPPSRNRYTGSIRQIRNESCQVCHHEGKKHIRGKLINHSCVRCHRPHDPWPSNKASFCLEDRVELLFDSPDRKQKGFFNE